MAAENAPDGNAPRPYTLIALLVVIALALLLVILKVAGVF